MENGTVNRRQVLIGGAAGALAALAPRIAWAEQKTGQRPNILCLTSEDNNPFLGCYGDEVAQTPTLDALAAEGVRYEHAFSSAPVCAPSRFALITGMYAESCMPGLHMRATAKMPDFVRGWPQYLREVGYYCTNNSKTDYNADIDIAATWDDSSGRAHWRNRPDGAPFLAIFNFMTTHESSLHNPRTPVTDPQLVDVPDYLPDTPEVRRDIAVYYDLHATLDGQIADVLAQLAADGLEDDTIVVYYGDHGGAMPRGKEYVFDSGLRTPLIIRFPPKWAHLSPHAPGSVVTSPVNLIDVPPTLLSVVGVPVPDYMHGHALAGDDYDGPQEYAFGARNRRGERWDFARTVRDERFRYIRYYEPHRIYMQHNAYTWQQPSMQVWEQHHLDGDLNALQERFWGTKPAEELYDLEADPDEVVNLADDERYHLQLARMRTALDRHMVAIRDQGFIPEGAPMEGYDQSRMPGAYPLQRVMALAKSAAERQPRNAPRFAANLRDQNEVVRYWAAQGLLMLGEGATGVAADMLPAFDAEPSPRVRVVLAEALVHVGHADVAVPYLTATMASHEDSIVRLMAVNALTYIPRDAAMPAIDVAEAAYEDPNQEVRSASRYLFHMLDGSYEPSLPLFRF